MKDHEIVDLYWERNEAAISASEVKYGNYCHSISYNILHNNEDAEECVNDTWLGAWKSMPPHRPKRLSVFLGKITRNLSIDRFKRNNTAKRGYGQTELALSELEGCIPDTVSLEEIVDGAFLAKTINDFLYSQPNLHRKIFIRRYWFFSSIKDISVTFGMSESKVTSLLFRLRNSLKVHLEKEGFGI